MRLPSLSWRRAAWTLAAAAALLPPAPPVLAQPENRGPELFSTWLRTHRPQAEAFASYLKQHQVADVAPLYQLLRSASMWRECKAQPFQVPPAAQWPAVRDVLLLLRELRRTGVVGPFEVVSAYRPPALNRCAGGSRRSSHMTKFAVDILPLAPGDDQRLCAFWRQQGKRWDMGLSRYPSGRIHVDRSGWRSWGSDYTRRTSFCNQLAQRPARR